VTDQSEPILPAGLVEGRHTPVFGEADLPEPLVAVHRTTVWATLHVRTGSVRYIDLAGPDARDQRLGAGDRAVIAPGLDHQIEPSTDARFFVQFYREPTDAPLGQAPPLPAGTHRHGGAWIHRDRDLDSVEEIFEMVTRQYADVVQDDLLAPYFSLEPEHLDWQAHIASVADYWEHVVLLAPDYDIDVLEGHRHLHERRTFTPALFDRWIQIFLDTVDGGWTGPNATHAKKRATGMARAMSLRYLGKGAWRPASAFPPGDAP
jgi:hemoglobin